MKYAAPSSQLRDARVAEAECLADHLDEPRLLLLAHQSRDDEARGRLTQAAADGDLGEQEHRHRDQETDVGPDVVEKRDPRSAEGQPRDRREEQEGPPGRRREDERGAPRARASRREPQAPQDGVARPAIGQDEGRDFRDGIRDPRDDPGR
jgi:hypothetical protein